MIDPLKFSLFLACALLSTNVECRGAGSIPAWSLVWADEFDSPNGSAPNPALWVYDLGGGGWGNSELESYTSRRENSRIEGGNLIIEARHETYTGTDGRQRDYTSARLRTKDSAAWTYGRFEARIKVPYGQGVWPAFWMLGENISTVGWPNSGELDIMENIGKEPSIVHGTAHGPGYSGAQGIGRPFTLATRFSDAFHIFAVDWETNRVRWSVDNHIYFTLTPSSLPAGAPWVFDKSQFLLLNLAIGGNWPGSPDASTTFPQQMLVDYVRVYARTAAPLPALSVSQRNDQTFLLWPALFPNAQLQRSELASGPWVLQDAVVLRQGENLEVPATAGFYRLVIVP